MRKVAFFDMDGTIVAPLFNENGATRVGFLGPDWVKYCNDHPEDAYKDCVPVKKVFKYAKRLREEGWINIILTVANSSGEQTAKIKWLNKHDPRNRIFQVILFANSIDDKPKFIKNYIDEHGIHPHDCMIIEDNYSTLLACIDIGVKSMHVTHILTGCQDTINWKNPNTVLSFEKPEKARSTSEHVEMYQADDAPPGVYVPNMSEDDMLKWKAKHIRGKNERVEIRKTLKGKDSYAQMLIVVTKDTGDGKPSIKISANGKMEFTIEDWEDTKVAIEEAFEKF